MLVPDSDTLSIRVRDRSDAMVLRLAGRFDMLALPAFDGAIRKVARRDIVMDLGGLTFMDGAAWLAVMAFEHRVRDWGSRLRVVNVRGRIRKIFELTETEYLLAEPVSR
jgi:anti-anti-sigma factor